MKTNIIITIFIMLFAGTQLKSQIKIHDDNHISLGSLTKSGGLQIQPEGFLYHQPTYTTGWAWYSSTTALNQYSKINIVAYNGSHKYFVLGNGQVYSNGTYYFSDSTLKTNINLIKSPLEKLKVLRGVSYDFKTEVPEPYTIVDNDGVEHLITPIDGDTEDLSSNEYVTEEAKAQIIAERKRKHLGFIAQEVEQIIPEVVRTTPDGEKSIAYHEILALCVEAIKELEERTSRLEDIQQKNSLLNERIKNLERQLEQLKSETLYNNSNDKADITQQESHALLYQNSPNPFSSETSIKCVIPLEANQASINIYNLNGTQIKTIPIAEGGTTKVVLKGFELNAGMYLYSLIIDNKLIDTKNMILTGN